MLSTEPGAVDWIVVKEVVRLRTEGVGEENEDDVAVVADGGGRDFSLVCATNRPSKLPSIPGAKISEPLEWLRCTSPTVDGRCTFEDTWECDGNCEVF